MLFSAIYHLFKDIDCKTHKNLAKFDYVGIVIMIAGSSTPPIYYCFYCEELAIERYVFSSFMALTCTLTYIVILTPKYDSAEYIKLRGSLFVACGLSTVVPCLYMEFCLQEKYLDDFRIYMWALGGFIYVSGALLYMFKFPERLFPGRFDIWG